LERKRLSGAFPLRVSFSSLAKSNKQSAFSQSEPS
jgi:hypothetical protein